MCEKHERSEKKFWAHNLTEADNGSLVTSLYLALVRPCQCKLESELNELMAITRLLSLKHGNKRNQELATT